MIGCNNTGKKPSDELTLLMQVVIIFKSLFKEDDYDYKIKN